MATQSYAPLEHQQVADLAKQMAAVLGPAMLAAEPTPLARAAWWAQKIVVGIGRLTDPNLPAGERAEWFDDLARSADEIRRNAYRQWASEAPDAELARFTEEAAIADVSDGAMVDSATADVLLPDGKTGIQVRLSTVEHEPGPRGWTTWTSDSPLPLAPIDGERHLEITHLLTSLGAVITPALHPELLDE